MRGIPVTFHLDGGERAFDIGEILGDDIGLQALQRLIGNRADLFRPAVHPTLAAIGIEVEAEFRGDHHLAAEESKRLS